MIDDTILSGLRVVEAAAFVAAPLGGMTLAQMGAEVIRIDPIAGGLDYHRWPVTPDNTSLRKGVCWNRYQTITEMLRTDPDCSPLNPLFGLVHQDGVGEILAPGIPLDFDAVMRPPPRPAPRLGADGEQVLSELLGVGSAEFGRLHDLGIVR